MEFPLGKFNVVSGVSGSGKSSLVNSVLKKALARVVGRATEKPGKFDEISGYESIEKVIISTKPYRTNTTKQSGYLYKSF